MAKSGDLKRFELEIVEKFNGGEATKTELASQYNCSYNAIKKIIARFEDKFKTVQSELVEVNGKVEAGKQAIKNLDTQKERKAILDMLKDYMGSASTLKEKVSLGRDILRVCDSIDGGKKILYYIMGDVNIKEGDTNIQLNIQNEINKIYPRLCDKCRKAVREE